MDKITGKNLINLTDGIMSLIKKQVDKNSKEFFFIDYLLDKLDVNKMGVLDCIAILRNLYPIKSFLNNWINFRDRVEQRLKDLNENSDKILRGLFEDRK